MKNGACLCGGIIYEVDDELKIAMNCHCKFCRRAHGSPYVTGILIHQKNLRILAGEELIEKFHVDKIKRRCFCRRCGTRMFNIISVPGFISLMAGTLKDPDSVVALAHINTESKCNKFQIHDGLPQYSEFPSQQDILKLLSENKQKV